MLFLSFFSLVALSPVSPLYIVVSLITFLRFLVGYLCLYSLMVPLLGILVLMVYLGSMMILNSYVCAVLPNSSFSSSNLKFSAFFWVFLRLSLSLFSLFGQLPALFSSNDWAMSLSQFFFSSFGAPLFCFLVTGMVVVLYCSSFVAVGAPLRSV